MAYREGTLHSLGDDRLTGAAHLLTVDAERLNALPHPSSRCIPQPSDGTTWWFPPMASTVYPVGVMWSFGCWIYIALPQVELYGLPCKPPRLKRDVALGITLIRGPFFL